MNRICKRLGAVGSAAALAATLAVPALAAENTAGIAVQLDGQNVAFTDAAPVAKSGRTFLPFRAVFEAMGVQVTSEGKEITAVRGDTTLHMTIGSSTATLTQGDKTSTISMDVAPYVDSATWRTYVPVRFAAEAFGCNVGWDQDDQTILIVDVDKLLGDATFTKMDQYISNLYEKQAEQNQATDGTFSMGLTMDSSLTGTEKDVEMKVDGTVTGVSSMTAAQLAMEMDLSDLATLVASDPAAMTAEQLAELKNSLAKTELELRMDLETGMYYIYAPILAQQNGGSGWYSMDLNNLFQMSGMDLSQLMGLYKDFSLEDTLRSTLASMPLSDRDTAYSMLTMSADSYVKLFSDGALKKDGDTYKATYTLNEGGVENITYTTVLTERDGEIVSMQVDMAVAASAEGVNLSTTAKIYADSTKSTIDMKMDLPGMMNLTLQMDLGYKPTDKEPETGLPAGVTATPLDVGMTVMP